MANQFRSSESEAYGSISAYEYETTLKLADQFIERSATDVALRNQVEEWKATLQNLGLEFARLESGITRQSLIEAWLYDKPKEAAQ